MKLFFARHGESEANIIHEISNRGWRHGLTERGRAQAAELAQRLAACKIQRVYTSPLQRASETAEIVASAFGLVPIVNDALREYDCGVAEGRSDPQAWQLWHDLRADWFEEGDLSARIPGGESYVDIRSRFVPFVHGLLSRSDESILLISHGGTLGCMLPEVCANLSHAWVRERAIPNTAFILAEARVGDGLVCLEYCGETL